MNNSFSFHAKNVFLTYPRCPASKEWVKDWFMVKFLNKINYFTIAEEDHEEVDENNGVGGHIHAVLSFKTKTRIRNQTTFDLEIYDNESGLPIIYHPNIQSPRNLKDVIEYCKKDGNYISNHENRKRSYGEIIKAHNSIDSFLEEIEEHYPRDLVLNLSRIREFAKWKFNDNDRFTYKVPEGMEFNIPDVMNSWLSQEV